MLCYEGPQDTEGTGETHGALKGRKVGVSQATEGRNRSRTQ